MTAGESSSVVRQARIVLLGFGAINRRVADLLSARGSAATVVGVIVKNPASLAPTMITGARVITRPEDLLTVAPDLVLEAASAEAVREWGAVALSGARRFVVSSASAFTDDELLSQLRRTARHNGSQLVLSPGAVAGIEALSAASRLGIREVRHRIVKPPRSWTASPGTSEVAPNQWQVLFQGSAREAARRYPLNANVTVVTALSGVGLDASQVELISDPSAQGNRHEIEAVGDFGSLSVILQNRALTANPKSSELAALALVRLAQNEAAEWVI